MGMNVCQENSIHDMDSRKVTSFQVLAKQYTWSYEAKVDNEPLKVAVCFVKPSFPKSALQDWRLFGKTFLHVKVFRELGNLHSQLRSEPSCYRFPN